MSADDTLILHRKEKVPVGNEERKQRHTRSAQGQSLISERRISALAINQDNQGDKYEREVQRIILEANFADSELFSSSESDISNDEEDDKSTLNFNDFLETFSGVPSLDAISVDSVHLKGLRSVIGKEQEESFNKDEGIFVDPLTGEVLRDKSEEKYEDIEEGHEEMETEESTETEALSDLFFSFSDDKEIGVLLEAPIEEIEVKIVDETEALDDFLMQDVIEERMPSTSLDKEAIEQERLRNMMLEETEVFLNKLINQVVARSEYKQPSAILREGLDKFALMDEISAKLEELEAERKTRFYLNRKVIDYYKRKKSFQNISEESEESEETDEKQIAKFNEAIKKLDHMLSTEDHIKDKYEDISKRLRAQKITMHQQNLEKEREFEALVRATLIKNNTGRLAVIIPKLIEEINTFRRNISDKRLQLIQFQHTTAVLQKKIDDFENQFRIREYMALQTETTELDKKIEERNADLENSRRRCNTDIHAFSHTKEKVDILRLFTQMKKRALATLQAEKKQVRERLIRLKVDRTCYQKEIRELTFQTGLLSKPSLLRDYDHTVEQLKDVKFRVESLRNQRTELVEKINKLEKKCGTGYVPMTHIKIK